MNTGVVAFPLELVVAVPTFVPPAKLPLAPPAGAVNVTTTPLSGEPLFVTFATSGWANAVLMVALWGVPLTAVTNSVTGLLVRVKFAAVDAPAAVADTVYVPVFPFAVNVEAVAMPFELVIDVVVLVALSLKVPLAPDNGAVNVTSTPLVGTPAVVTVATSGAAKLELITVLCGVPLVAVMISPVEAVLVRLKFAGVDRPITVAETV